MASFSTINNIGIGSLPIICGMSSDDHFVKYNTKLHIHHINSNKKDCRLENLQTLCSSCHSRKTHAGRKHPKKTGEKISIALKGKKRTPYTEEEKQQIAIRAKMYWNKVKSGEIFDRRSKN